MIFTKRIFLPVVLIPLLILASAWLGQALCVQFGKSPHLSVDGSSKSGSYVLVAPVFIGGGENKGEVYLLDSLGRTVHVWKTRYPVMRAELKPDGSLYVSLVAPGDPLRYPSFGTTGILQKLSWDGSVLWEYTDPAMTHDFDVLPDGGIAYIAWEPAPQVFAQGVIGGYATATSTVWTNAVIVVNPQKQETWRWNAYDHLLPWNYPLPETLPQVDWSHMNSVQYVENNPITHTSAFLISMRNISRLFFIDAHTGKIIWQSPQALTSLQHDATLLSSGTILVFDNGVYNAQTHGSTLLSRVVEFNPANGHILWEYSGGSTPTERASFASSVMGGAERLPDGNTLITLSTEGRIMEVTPNKQVAWEYDSQFRDSQNRVRSVFKARAYSSVGTAWSAWIAPFNLFSSVCLFGH